MALELKGLKLDSFQCRNHPDREGVGICVSCRRVICIECSTKIEGVNHCRDCLAKRGATAVAQARPSSGVLRKVLEGAFALAVVVGSIALVAGTLVLYGDSRAHGSATHVGNRDRMDAIAEALESYKRDVGAFPPDAAGMASLRSLVVEPPGVTGWRGPYLDLKEEAVANGVPDAYGTPVRYWLSPAGERCAIGSAGADRRFESQVEGAKRLPSAGGNEALAQGDDLVLIVD